MGAYTTLAIDTQEYDNIISTLKAGYIDNDGGIHRPNERVAAAMATEFNLGIRVSDIVKLTLSDIVKDGSNHYRLDIVEKKTGKPRTLSVNLPIYNYLKSYCDRNNISSTARMFGVTERNIQMRVKEVREYLGLDRVSTHSFRKAAGNDIYESTGHDIVAVQEFYGHSSATTTQTYLKRSNSQLEKALDNHVRLI